MKLTVIGDEDTEQVYRFGVNEHEQMPDQEEGQKKQFQVKKNNLI